MKIIDIITAYENKVFALLGSVRADGKKRYDRRRYMEKIDAEIRRFQHERAEIIRSEGLDPGLPFPELSKAEQWPIIVGRIDDYLDTESEFKPEPLFTWDEVDVKTTTMDEKMLEKVGAVAPYVPPEEPKKPSATRAGAAKGAHGKRRAK